MRKRCEKLILASVVLAHFLHVSESFERRRGVVADGAKKIQFVYPECIFRAACETQRAEQLVFRQERMTRTGPEPDRLQYLRRRFHRLLQGCRMNRLALDDCATGGRRLEWRC